MARDLGELSDDKAEHGGAASEEQRPSVHVVHEAVAILAVPELGIVLIEAGPHCFVRQADGLWVTSAEASRDPRPRRGP
ncbi:hypothetical protein [Amycolatopsis sp. FDAARGOS 1241]|uniref:hypothetical protein n=1 Tax=Amycolatopsis sp. FDAARGOS 1241 TaxID=2778070 RepID=UPI001951E87D|nr:hypothetical protein [Amycolatopsis sp. FDAARGOS 1241]QRP46647.1 hypothetical protein I6J71_00770 [Amycolatopsis sp. FDAARGOS 1241]